LLRVSKLAGGVRIGPAIDMLIEELVQLWQHVIGIAKMVNFERPFSAQLVFSPYHRFLACAG
jgi:hypothetical protein